VGFEHLTKIWDGLKGRGQVGIPIACKVGVRVKSIKQTLPHSFGFAYIPRQIDIGAVLRLILVQGLDNLQRRIVAAIIDEHKPV
jgi:hypothetical protein